jgi:YfiH family protein
VPGEVLDRRVLDDGRTATVVVTGRADGDLCVDLEPEVLDRRRRQVIDHPWTWLRQVHGAEVVEVDAPSAGAGRRADAAVTAAGGAVLAVHTADCAPVALLAPEGVVGVAHAGWRGLVAGVLEATVEGMRRLGAGAIDARVGPCIHPGCYAFGEQDLTQVTEVVGEQARARTTSGAPALDLPAAVSAVLHRSGIADVRVDPRCTGCHPGFFSHRVDGDGQRQAMVVWMGP